ncbi:MAG: glycoside hydrolase family 71/99-like protein [Verrucomicrobia bacterium]|nr:glycoside hydrolase family 71/99-like protein [Verrucomicrobiota bacterium]
MRLLFTLPLLLATLHAAPPATVDPSTLTGKVMCGYQGWFNCEGDGANLGWTHWGRGHRNTPAPGNITIDLWPDLSEYGPDERYPTGFKNPDGSPAEVFSSHNKPSVLRHFEWMRDYGIDGVFVQRFANGLGGGKTTDHKHAVLNHCREGARLHGRTFAVMYDLSGIREGGTSIVRTDWNDLRQKAHLTEDANYLHHEGKPVVAVWGIGFGDDRHYTLDKCRQLVEFLKADGCTVLLGVPTGWREGTRDATKDPALQKLIAAADIVSPWTVGRYNTPDDVKRHAKRDWSPDLAWCKERDLDYLPVLFPGFSWHNMPPDAKLGAIPRLKGQFLWSQFVAAKRAGCDMIYVAMFDEVDEGTAIFKCSNTPPVSDLNQFLTYEGLPSDFYLRLTGAAGKLLRNEIPVTDAVPKLGNDKR